jgi:CubicO group peptidase (beta-lactamase class C family)
LVIVAVMATALLAGLSGTSGRAGASVAAGSSDAATLSRSQVADSFATLDQIVKADMKKTGVPGVAVAVVSGDEVVYKKGYGVRSTKTKEPVTPRTVFQIASLSKPISSTIMAGLVGEGTFAWTDPIAKYTSGYALSDPWVTDHVTFADLFAHRSGLPGAAGNDLEALGFDRATILQRLRYVPLDPFRVTYSYSNFGMTLGGEAGAEAANSTWEEVAQRVLFGPAGMTSTSMSHDDFVAQENRADLHVKIDGKWVPDFTREPDAQAPAGGVSSNVVDLGEWMRIQLNDGKIGGKRIIGGKALDATHTPAAMKSPPDPITSPARFYGLGWDVTTEPNGAVTWNHSGAFSNGAATAVKLLPSKKIGIVVLTNGAPIGLPEAIAADYIDDVTTGSSNASSLAAWTKRFAGIYGPKPDLTKPANPTAARDVAAYVGTYHNDYVGDVQIVSNGGKLQLVAGPKNMTFDLEHFDGDTFLYVSAPETPDYPSKVTFDVGADGTATALTDSTFEGSHQATLTRV